MFHGSIVALVTPMHLDGSIDYPSLEKLIAWHLENKTDAIVVLGTTGESPTIENDERTEIIRLTVAAVNKKIPVIVGAGSNATAHAIHWSEEALELGADGVLLVTPYYNKPTQEGLFQHYSAIAKSVSIPQILYNVPGRTACDLLPETILRLAQHKNIVAVKEATGDITRLQRLLSYDLKMSYFTGNDDNAFEFMSEGGHGVISVAANVIPKVFSDFCRAALSKHHQIAQKMDLSFRELYRVLFLESNPIPTKWALQKMGLIQSGIRLPLTSLSESGHAQVLSVLKTLQLL